MIYDNLVLFQCNPKGSRQYGVNDSTMLSSASRRCMVVDASVHGSCIFWHVSFCSWQHSKSFEMCLDVLKCVTDVEQSQMFHGSHLICEDFLDSMKCFLWQNSTLIYLLNSLCSLNKWILVEFCQKKNISFFLKKKSSLLVGYHTTKNYFSVSNSKKTVLVGAYSWVM